MAKSMITAVLLFLCLGCGKSGDVADPMGDGNEPEFLGRWLSRASLPTPRQEVPHAVLNEKIYVPGGIDQNRSGSTLMEVYTPASNSWSSAARLPEPLHHLGLASANGKLYVLGGYRGNSFSPTNVVYEYNPAADDWQVKSPMPTTRGAHIAVAFDGKIFVIGGANQFGEAISNNEMYDPITDSWTTVSPMPTPREHLAAAVIDSLIYVVGGRSANSGTLINSRRLEAYAPASDIWYSLANMPTARGGLAAASLDGKLYVFGGEIPGVFSENEQYDPVTDGWQKMTPMPTPRHGMGAATIDGVIYVIGGARIAGFGVSNVNEGFTLSVE